MPKKITIHVIHNSRYFCGNNPRGVDNVFLSKKEADKYALELNEEAGRRGLSRPDFSVVTRRIKLEGSFLGHIHDLERDTGVYLRANGIELPENRPDVCFRPISVEG